MNERHIIIGLDAMGRQLDAAIVAIAAVELDLASTDAGRLFYSEVRLQTAMRDGGTLDGEMLRWLLRQPDAASHPAAHGTQDHSGMVCDLVRYLRGTPGDDRALVLWGRGGLHADVPRLRWALERAGHTAQWKQERCYSTAAALRPDVPRLELQDTGRPLLDKTLARARHLALLLPAAQCRRLDSAAAAV